MNVAIRADAGLMIGMGHLMRSLTLAHGLKERGCNVSLLTYCENDDLYRKASDSFENTVRIANQLDHLNTISIIKSQAAEWVVLDSYDLDETFQRSLKDEGLNLLTLDDFVHLKHYCADIILNQNFGAERLIYNTEPYSRLLLGTDYVLLRKEFQEYRHYKREIAEYAGKILVTLGGVDYGNHSLKIINAVNEIKTPLQVKVVAGAGNPHYDTLLAASAQSRHDIEILRNVSGMAKLMEWADIGISAGGTTLWELASMGLPCLLCIVADNQTMAVNALSEQGIPSIGWIDRKSVQNIHDSIAELLPDKRRRTELSRMGRSIIDGKGIDRIMEAMEKN